MAQQRRALVAVLGTDRDADAGADVGVQPVERERLVERRQEALGGAHAVGATARGRHDRDELVAAQPGERERVGQLRPHPVGDLAQQLVPDVVAERVVDLLEAVDVDEQQADRLAAGRGRIQRRLDRLQDVPAVAEPVSSSVRAWARESSSSARAARSRRRR